MNNPDQDTLLSTNFFFKEQVAFNRGKVRDIYTIGSEHIVMIASDRISAFDHVLTHPIPFKGQVLNQIASKFLDDTKHIVPNWKIEEIDPHVTVGYRCEPYAVEFVVRGYLAGHAWREYNSGKREVCGVSLPDGLKENDKLPYPILTPSTKAESGHDMDISKEEIIAQRIIKKKDLDLLEKYSLELFKYGSKHADERGLILVDTKYEFGKKGDKIMLIDEIHTPDSSRYFYKNGYEDIQLKDQQQKQLSKEFVRQWLISNNFQGLEGQSMPSMPDEFIQIVSQRYIELYENITGGEFERRNYNQVSKTIEKRVNEFIITL
ncbi:MAG: phosphoribosylaminoimidazolesuccinocarboxamide synthase [Bacteroidia bacterium]|nr:phosphoribosylaminoimidazolesuccinocarboxamide synthase [Bacteroidia bacterium]|tara:strand:- start:6668 stop:7627 length:960 start_codon:yes stop_codon:yes gene_type:complete